MKPLVGTLEYGVRDEEGGDADRDKGADRQALPEVPG